MLAEEEARGLTGSGLASGNTVNTASRMESNGVPGRVQCTQRAAGLFPFPLALVLCVVLAAVTAAAPSDNAAMRSLAPAVALTCGHADGSGASGRAADEARQLAAAEGARAGGDQGEGHHDDLLPCA